MHGPIATAQTGDASQVVTVRAVGRGESELWVHSTGNTRAAQERRATLSTSTISSASRAARWSNISTALTLTPAVLPYPSKAPAQVTASLNGDAGYDFVLVGPGGKEIHYTANMKPQGSSPGPSRMSALYSPEPARPVPRLLPGAMPLFGLYPGRAMRQCRGLREFGFGAGVAIGAVLALAFESSVRSSVLVAVMTGEVAFLEGALLAGIGFGGVGAGCNGDPYFVDPGLHTLPAVLSGATSSTSSAPIEITR